MNLPLRVSGATWMVVAGVFFAIMGAFVKLGAKYFSTAELVFYRCFIGFLAILLLVGIKRHSLRTPVLSLHVSRGAVGFTALMLYFYAISHLPLATAVTLNYTSPLFLVVLTAVFLREQVSKRVAGAIALGFLGVVVLLKPTFDQSQWFAGVVGLTSALFAGMAYLNIRKLGEAGEPEWRVVFYFSLVASIGAGCFMLTHSFSPLTRDNIWIVLGMGSAATIAQLALTRAYTEGKTLVTGALSYSTIVFASLIGIVLWNESLPWSSWLGMAIIIGSGVLALGLQRARTDVPADAD